MARARGSFRGRGISDSQRRKKVWLQIVSPATGTDGVFSTLENSPNMNLVIPDTGMVPGPSVGSSLGLVSDPTIDKIPPESTILRIRGSLNLPKNELGLRDITTFAVGIGVMEATAAALGAFPNPATPDGGAWDGWMFYRSQQAGALDANATFFDVKSMRKVQSGQAVILVFGGYQATSDGGNVVVPETQMQINMRVLILLP